jgi:uncharacterized protein YqeY
MTDLRARLRRDLDASRKAHDKPLTLLLGTILADVNNRALELGRDPTDDETGEVLRRGIKKRREAEVQFRAGNRLDLAEREQREVTVLETYLPSEPTDDEIRAVVREVVSAGARDMGAVMGRVMPRFKGRADGARVNAIVREELAARG